MTLWPSVSSFVEKLRAVLDKSVREAFCAGLIGLQFYADSATDEINLLSSKSAAMATVVAAPKTKTLFTP